MCIAHTFWKKSSKTLYKRIRWKILGLIDCKTKLYYKYNVFYLASGDICAERADGKSIVPDSNTSLPGRNFKLLGFGVSCI